MAAGRPPRRRVGGDRAYVVDSKTGKSVDLTAGAKPGERFTGAEPAFSPDRRRLALWRCTPPRAPGESLIVDSYALFDLETGAWTELPAPVRVELRHDLRPAWSPRPTAWWTADGSALYAVVGSPCQSLARCAPDGSRPTTVSSVGNSRKIVDAAVDGPFVVFAVEDDRRFEVRDVAGKALFVLDEPAQCRRLAWTSDGAAFLVDVERKDSAQRWRVELGVSTKTVDVEPARLLIPPMDPKWSIAERRPMDHHFTLLYSETLATHETVTVGPGHDARAFGDVVVYWSAAKEAKEDLWAFDPNDGATIRLTDRGFAPRSWDVVVTPPASRGR